MTNQMNYRLTLDWFTQDFFFRNGHFIHDRELYIVCFRPLHNVLIKNFHRQQYRQYTGWFTNHADHQLLMNIFEFWLWAFLKILKNHNFKTFCNTLRVSCSDTIIIFTNGTILFTVNYLVDIFLKTFNQYLNAYWFWVIKMFMDDSF